MNMLQEEFELIEKYLEGTLEGANLIAFEKRLTEDSEMAEIVEEQRLLRDAIQEENLREKLNDFHHSLSENKQSSSNKVIFLKSYARYAVAACIAVLLFWGGFTYLNGAYANKAQNEQLFAAHFTPDPGLPTTMSASDNYDFFDAMVSYKQEDYKKAITKWQPLLNKKPENDTLNYFLGVANLAQGNEDEAITFLQWAAENNNSHFLSDTYYYLGLAYLKSGKASLAIKALEKSDLDKSKPLIEKIKQSE